MSVTCFKWGSTAVPWFMANWKWSECLVTPPTPPSGSAGGGLQPPGVDATTLIQPWLIEPWNPYRSGSMERKKRLIKLICKVDGEIYEREKEVGNMNLSVDDIKTIESINDIDLDIRLEE